MTEQSTFTPEQSRRLKALTAARQIVVGIPADVPILADAAVERLVTLAEYVLHGLPDDEPEQTFHPGGMTLDGRGLFGALVKGEHVIVNRARQAGKSATLDTLNDAAVTDPAAFIPTREAEIDPATHEEPARIYTLVDKDGDEWAYDIGRNGWTIIGGRRAHQWHDLAGLAPFTIKGAAPHVADELRRTGE